MSFFSVLLMALWILGPRMTDSAFSMCQDLDFEAARTRRIQAVRGQILSKLQLETPPKEEGVPHPLPHEVMLLYNSTREPVRRMVTCERRRSTALHEDEEYYAKEVRRVEMLAFGHADSKMGGSYLQHR
uniref:TGF-beta propeptide domain-containing protein n=1 Tax=Pseudonaja textilis TaxID=8673 RepID=A0A670Z0L4_PSETE